ncbi:hypothetical protein LTR10_018464 [Elasticomyces elasticus]|uniref:Major facilitator superfamily (MFS) profile domain-containing protein n=1 Tax=Exophiala sideris TaxID=1016849 RepID=A0ABR0J0I6_9EURO|nr:hypothetical protein LTR10_018464 [Elasticomyces elasticus]KAK5030039.1 hypothetical protein LTR13_008351 [Exophiala sideris]KAK5053534.1 hypothetical protein LTR69_009178 [Exophiala sideris]
MLTSICTQYWQVILAQGLCVGVGMGCLFVPSVALLSTYFNTRVTIATGIAASGSGIGGVFFPIIFHRLEPQIGFPWATRVMAFISLATLCLPSALMRLRVKPASKRQLIDLSAWKEPAYVLYILGCFVAFMGTWTPFFYIGIYALDLKMTSADTAFYLLTVISAGSVFGRLVPNFLAAKYGMFNVLIVSTAITGVLAFAFIGAKHLASLIVVAVLYGLSSGALVSIAPTLVVQLCPNRALIGTRMGMAFASIGVGMLIGTPLAGRLFGVYGYTAAFSFSATSAIVGACLLTVSRGFFCGWKLWVKC